MIDTYRAEEERAIYTLSAAPPSPTGRGGRNSLTDVTDVTAFVRCESQRLVEDCDQHLFPQATLSASASPPPPASTPPVGLTGPKGGMSCRQEAPTGGRAPVVK